MRRLRLTRKPLILLLLILVPLLLLPILPRTASLPALGGRVTVQAPSTSLARRCGIRVGVFSQAAVDAACAVAAAAAPAICRVARIDHLDQSGFVAARLRLRTGSVVKIFVYPPSDLISGHILRRGGWEGPVVGFLTQALRAWPDSALIDIGSGVGVYSLNAARVGRRVLAIDANYQNAIRLAKSAQSNAYSRQVRVYWNALSDQPAGTEFTMRLPADCNIGGGAPAPPGAPGLSSGGVAELADDIRVRAAGLDQLVAAAGDHLSGASALFIKLDIEGHEWTALATGQELFSRRAVPLIVMEWTATRRGRPDRAEFVVRFLTLRGYRAYDVAGGTPAPGKPLPASSWQTWPGDIVWARNLTQLTDSWR